MALDITFVETGSVTALCGCGRTGVLRMESGVFVGAAVKRDAVLGACSLIDEVGGPTLAYCKSQRPVI